MNKGATSGYKLRPPYPLINPKKKFILFTNAKCGGTTLKSWFLDSLDLENTFSNSVQALKNFGVIFLFKWYKYRFLNHDLEKIKFSNAYLRKFIRIYRRTTLSNIKRHVNDLAFYKVAVVRNPFDCLVSGYVDKFCGEDINRSCMQAVITQIDSKDANGNAQITFAQFVDYLYSRNLMEVNSHWRHQTFVFEGVKLDEVIHLKDMSAKLPELSKKLGFQSEIDFSKHRQSNSYRKDIATKELSEVYHISNNELIEFKSKHGCFPEKNAFYDDEIRQKVRAIYKRDFEMLGY
ncbi:sulfotransferase family 2 domain-containing protein [Winogradskyella sp.]|uniref:sulfotransferase family 2 domain-containing protein n=1 Tax=Winogradskyella sp. TaxID=1883156 RepID=UPI003F6B2B9D